jgi:hypothetical protein
VNNKFGYIDNDNQVTNKKSLMHGTGMDEYMNEI